MSKATRRLGRGLDSLVSNLRSEGSRSELGTTLTQMEPVEAEGTAGPSAKATMLPVAELRPNPFQPRSMSDSANVLSLANSIRRTGLLQPIVVRPFKGRYEIIAGERRWQAAQSAGLTRVPVMIRDATDEQMLELALVENIQREDLNAVDRARAYRQFCTTFHLKPEEVGERVGEDRTTVLNYLRLLDLPDAVLEMVAGNRLSMGHARCLLAVTDEQRRIRLAESAMQNELSVRALEDIVRREKTRQQDPSTAGRQAARPRSAHLSDLQRRFEEAVKTKVAIHESRRKGSGRIVIEYYSLDDFDRIASLLGVEVE